MYSYIQLLFGIASVGDVFQKKVDKLFYGMPNVFGIALDILIVGFDEIGRNHDATLDKVLGIYRKANLKLKKDRFLFWCTSIPFFGEVTLQQGVSPDPRKVQALTDMPPQSQKENCSHSWVYSSLNKYSPVTAEWKLSDCETTCTRINMIKMRR